MLVSHTAVLLRRLDDADRILFHCTRLLQGSAIAVALRAAKTRFPLVYPVENPGFRQSSCVSATSSRHLGSQTWSLTSCIYLYMSRKKLIAYHVCNQCGFRLQSLWSRKPHWSGQDFSTFHLSVRQMECSEVLTGANRRTSKS